MSDKKENIRQPRGLLALRAVAMPKDTNQRRYFRRLDTVPDAYTKPWLSTITGIDDPTTEQQFPWCALKQPPQHGNTWRSQQQQERAGGLYDGLSDRVFKHNQPTDETGEKTQQ